MVEWEFEGTKFCTNGEFREDAKQSLICTFAALRLALQRADYVTRKGEPNVYSKIWHIPLIEKV